MPAVSVERVPVRTLKLGLLGFDHLQIVLQPDATGDRQDGWFVIEGVRDTETGAARLAVEGWHGGTTLSDANGGRVGTELSDWIGTSASRGAVVVAHGAEAMSVWSTLVSYAAEIEAQRLPYIAYALPASALPTINSSSLVASLLHYAGIDTVAAQPSGLRFSPGMTTLLGTSMDDTMKAGRTFSTLIAGDGDDTLFGSDEAGQLDKLFGGRGRDTLYWSAGSDVLHGGQPGLAHAEDGTDAVDYSGVGRLHIERPASTAGIDTPDFVVRHAHGVDRLYSIEEVIWDEARDVVSLGSGVALSPRPLKGSDPGVKAAEATSSTGRAACLGTAPCSDDRLYDEFDLDLEMACGLFFCGGGAGHPTLAMEDGVYGE